MKKILLTIISILFLNTIHALANPGDTVVVQTFNFGSPQNAWFVFPSDTVRFEKILMKYTLKCNPAQSPACGEWDYLTYTYLYDHTGLQDSSLVHQPVFMVNGTTPATYSYMNTPSYSYHPSWQYHAIHSDTTSLNTYTIGVGTTNDSYPFGAVNPVSRSQFLWKASEITAAGMSAGNITGLKFYLQSLGGQLHDLKINIKATALDSLTQGTFNSTGFTNVYSHNTQFTLTGWNSLQLTTPFAWDGISNLIIDMTYDNSASLLNNVVAASPTTFSAGLTNSGTDRVASFHSYGFVNVPMNTKLVSILQR